MDKKKEIKKMKEFICNEEIYLNKGSKKLRMEILNFLITNNCNKYINESSDGIRIDLDLLDDNTISKLYYFICYKIGINIDEFY